MADVLRLGAWQIAFWSVAGMVLVAVGWVTVGGQHRRQTGDRQLAWWLWHWCSGGLLETSRTFPGLDEEAPVETRAARRAALGAARTSVLVVALAVWYVHAGAPHGTAVGTVLAAGVIGAGIVVGTALAIAHAACRLAHYLQWVRPLHLAVQDVLGWPESKKAHTYITVPRDRAGGLGVVVGFPPNFDLKPQSCEVVSNIVRRKLDLGGKDETTETWVPAGRHSYVLFRPRDPMPESCYYRDPATKALVAAASPSAPVVGVTRGGKPVTVDLESESPHVLISAGSGGGKSETVKALAAQMMANGALVMLLDFKRHSHRWLNAVPGVHYVRDIEDIHHLLIKVAKECERRNRAWDDIGIDEPGPVFPRLVLLCEEMTVTMSKLRRWWKSNRFHEDPVISPAIEALEDIACVGRQVRIHIVAVAQMATAKSIGGSEIRENFAVRIMGRYTKRAWEMLVPECEYVPANRKPGRMQVCVGGTATEMHGLMMTDKEARELALAGATVPQRDSIPVSQGKEVVAATATADNELAASPPTVELVSLSEAVETGLLLITLANLRSYRARDAQFPAPISKDGQTLLYDKDRLVYWARNKERDIVRMNA